MELPGISTTPRQATQRAQKPATVLEEAKVTQHTATVETARNPVTVPDKAEALEVQHLASAADAVEAMTNALRDETAGLGGNSLGGKRAKLISRKRKLEQFDKEIGRKGGPRSFWSNDEGDAADPDVVPPVMQFEAKEQRASGCNHTLERLDEDVHAVLKAFSEGRSVPACHSGFFAILCHHGEHFQPG